MNKVLKNEQITLDDIQPVIDEQIVDTVHDIFEAIVDLNPLHDIFEDLANRLIDDLKANSLMEYNLELKDEQKDRLRNALKQKGDETVNNYLANLAKDSRTKLIYGHVREKTTAIADAVLSSIGQEINRGTIINATAVQASSKNEKYDEILFRKSKSSGDIAVPTSCVIISTNCIEVIKASCQEEKGGETGDGAEGKEGEETEPNEKKPGKKEKKATETKAPKAAKRRGMIKAK